MTTQIPVQCANVKHLNRGKRETTSQELVEEQNVSQCLFAFSFHNTVKPIYNGLEGTEICGHCMEMTTLSRVILSFFVI